MFPPTRKLTTKGPYVTSGFQTLSLKFMQQEMYAQFEFTTRRSLASALVPNKDELWLRIPPHT